MSTLATQALALGTGMMAGLYFAFSAFVMRSLAELPSHEGIHAMQSINRVIVRSPFIALFFATSAASLAVAVWGVTRWDQPGGKLLVAAGVLYVVGHFVCTAAFNVPLNDALDAVAPASPDGASLWGHYLRRWTAWNHVRTVACTGTSVLLIRAAQAFA